MSIAATPKPPPVALLNVNAKPAHTFELPKILPALGIVFMLIAFMAVSLPHALLTIYLIVSKPMETPVTTPAETVADVLVLLQAPPLLASVRLIVEPIQTEDVPLIVPALGIVFIVIAFITVSAPHVLLTTYLIVSRPVDTPVTTPPTTVA